MLHPKTTLPSPALLASCWKAFGSVIYLFFSLGKWGKSAGFAFLAGDALKHQLSPVLGVRGPRRAEPGVSKVFLHSQDWCEKINVLLICWRRSPAVEALLPVPCVWWFHGLSPCPTEPAVPTLPGALPWAFTDLSWGKSWHSALHLDQVLQGALGTLLLLFGGINDGWKPILLAKTNIPNSDGLSQLKVAANQLRDIVTEMNI